MWPKLDEDKDEDSSFPSRREAEAEADPEAAYYARSLYSPYGRALPYARNYYGLGYRSYAGVRPYGLGYRSYAGLRPYGYYY